MGPKSIEEKYQKKTQIEHILLRPDSYVGSTSTTSEKIFVYDKKSSKMIQKSITYVPALYKIFDEILVNAADNFQRDQKNMNEILIEINCDDVQNPWISVKNNGKSLPVSMHKVHKCYVPELVFGHL